MAASDRQHQRSWVEYLDHPVPCMISSESDSMLPLVGSASSNAVQMGQLEEGGSCALRVPGSQPRGRPPKQCSAKDGMGNLPPSSLDRDGVGSDGYSMVSKAPSSCHCRRKWHGEKRLAPACLDMLIFKSTDPNADVSYTLWRFDVQGWLDQYQEESMMLHIYNSWRGYPGQWVHSLDGGPNLMVTELLEWMDHTFGDVHEYNMMIHSLYEIRQKEGESMEEYMVQIHEAVSDLPCIPRPSYAPRHKSGAESVLPWPSTLSVRCLEFAMAELPEREQASASFDTLYMLAKKMEAHQPSHMHRGRGLLMLIKISTGGTPLPQSR